MIEQISSKEFDRYARKSPYHNFYQTSAWGFLKEKNGWKKHFVALKENDTIKAATLLLEKRVYIGSIFYAPRGFLVDYEDFDLLRELTTGIKQYVKKHKGILFKIDPYLELVERDMNGEIVKEGTNHGETVNELLKLGYRPVYDLHEKGGLQPNWLFILELQGVTEESLLKNMDSQTRWAIHKVQKIDFDIVEVDKKGIVDYKKIMEHTSMRRGFIDRSLAYYQDMYNALGDDIKILIARLNISKYRKQLKQEQDGNELLKKECKEKLEAIPNSKKFNNQLKVCLETEASLDKKIEELDQLEKKYGDQIDMAGAMFITYGDEVVYLFSGAYDEFMHFNAQYALQWKMIRYAILHGYQRYNFYGISNHFTKDDPMYGIYMFKKGFGGHVVELIGEYDYAVRKWKYLLYRFALKLYRLMKR